MGTRSLVGDLRQGLRSLWRWFPVIWADRNWDQWYIYTILETKLRFQEGYLRESNLYIGVEEDCANMRECIDLIGRLKEDKYEEELYDAWEAEWAQDGTIADEKAEQARKAMHGMFAETDKQTTEARTRLFALIRDNIDRWWD